MNSELSELSAECETPTKAKKDSKMAAKKTTPHKLEVKKTKSSKFHTLNSEDETPRKTKMRAKKTTPHKLAAKKTKSSKFYTS